MSLLKFFKNVFSQEKIKNPYFKIAEKILSKEIDLDKYNVYYITGFENNNKNVEHFDTSIGKDLFFETLKRLNYNSKANNLSVYYISKNDNEGCVYLVTDPLDLYENGRIFKKYSVVLDERIMSLETVELIKVKSNTPEKSDALTVR